MKKKILHIVTGLGQGGAEGVLFRLVQTDTSNHHIIVSIAGSGHYYSLFHELSIDTYVYDFSVEPISSFVSIYALIREKSPDLIQSWMYHSDFIASLYGAIFALPVVWCIRNSTLSFKSSRLSTLLFFLLNSFLSYVSPKYIISCSFSAKRLHLRFGFADRFVVIPNGFDPNLFSVEKPQNVAFSANAECRDKSRLKLPVFGMLARYHPQKDHVTLIRALRLLRDSGIDFRCLLSGPGIDNSSHKLISLVSSLGLSDSISLMGPTASPQVFYELIDFHVLSSSFGEAFPNVIAEAMLCGVPCIATDVGDSSLIVGDCGWVVEPGNVQALATALSDSSALLNDSRYFDLSIRCRMRVARCFSLLEMCEAYDLVWSCAVASFSSI